MINIHHEPLIPLSAVPLHVPSTRPGKQLNVATVYRWSKLGVNGRRLETVLIGGGRFTSIEAIARFIEQSSKAAGGGVSNSIPSHTTDQEGALSHAD